MSFASCSLERSKVVVCFSLPSHGARAVDEKLTSLESLKEGSTPLCVGDGGSFAGVRPPLGTDVRLRSLCDHEDVQGGPSSWRTVCGLGLGRFGGEQSYPGLLVHTPLPSPFGDLRGGRSAPPLAPRGGEEKQGGKKRQ